MKKILFILCLAVAATLLCSNALAIDVYVNGEKILYNDSTGYPFYEKETVLVPLYKTAESFGASVVQDNPNGTVLVKHGSVTVSASTDENAFYRNGVKITSDAGLVWQGGPLYVPAVLFEALDAEVFFSGSTVTIASKADNGQSLRLYASSYDKAYRGARYFGAKYEPQCGIYPGLQYPESKDSVLDGLSGAGTLVYADAKSPILPHADVLTRAAESGRLVQYVLCEDNISEISDGSEKYIKIAQSLEKSGAKILFRLHCSEKATAFTEKFRIVSDIFRTHAPSVALVWEIEADSSEQDIIAAYPGDRYLDYVGTAVNLGAYYENSLSALDSAVSLFGYKKPVIITEISSDISCGNELLDFYTYLPIRYPQVKAVFLREPDENATVPYGDYLTLYGAGTSGFAYLSAANAGTEGTPCYFQLGNGVTVPPSKIRLYCYAGEEKNRISHITYLLNGEPLQDLSPTAIPYEAEIDFSSYAGQTIILRVRALDNAQQPFAENVCKIRVSSAASADNRIGENTIPVTNALAAVGISLAGLVAVLIIIKKLRSIL